MKHIFIINPAAGKGDLIHKLEEEIRTSAESFGAEYEIYYSKCVGDAERMVRDYCKISDGSAVRFYACGGDGTLNEVANGTVGFPFAQLGVIPIGTGNDFVKNFKNPEKFMDVSAQINGRSIGIDGIKVCDRYAINMVNMGFDCSVVESSQKIKRYPLISSGLAYIAGVLIEFIRLPGTKMKKLLIDGENKKKSLLQLCAFANGGFYGGGFHNAPLAKANDGLIDVCYVNPVSRLQFATMIGSYKKGTHLENKRIMKIAEYHKCKNASIDFEGETSVCIDGEITKFSHIDLSIAPGVFNFVLPEGAEYAGMERANEDTCVV